MKNTEFQIVREHLKNVRYTEVIIQYRHCWLPNKALSILNSRRDYGYDFDDAHIRFRGMGCWLKNDSGRASLDIHYRRIYAVYGVLPDESRKVIVDFTDRYIPNRDIHRNVISNIRMD